MFRWASIIGSSIAVALLGTTSIIGFIEAAWMCVGWHWIGGPPSRCVTLYSVALWPFFLGLGFTTLLAIIHLVVAARQKRWGWFNALLLAPPLCFCMSAYVGGSYSSRSFLFFIICLPFIGLPNLLFSIKVLNQTQEAATTSPPGEELLGIKWISIICSSIGAALLGGISVIVSFEEAWGCVGLHAIYPAPYVCYGLYTLIPWTFLLGIGLTALFGLIHLGIAASRYKWGWFNALLMVPPLCVFIGPYLGTLTYIGGIYIEDVMDHVGRVLFIISLPLAGLPNLLFGIKVLKPGRVTVSASPSGAEPVPVPPLGETSEQQQS
jgi:hypothetical protein